MHTHSRAPQHPASRLVRPLLLALTSGALVLSLPGVAAARPGGGGWGGRGWGGGGGWGGGSGWGGDLVRGSAAGPTRAGPPEDRVTVASFVTEDPADAATLRRGAIAVTGAPTGSGVESMELAVYSAAVVDQLAQLGYRTDVPDPSAEQVTELHIAHATLQPEEVKRPVSGTMAVGVSNFGTSYGMAVNVDLTKPKSALISTTLEARIRDRASGRVLWEGRADIATRAGDDRWPAGAIASKLAAALFDHFPVPSSPPS